MSNGMKELKKSV